MKDLTDRALQVAAVMVLFALALRWTWSVVAPMAPILLVAVGIWIVFRVISRRRRGW